MSPAKEVKSLLTTVEETQKQLREALRLLSNRDKQIGVALDGLEIIVEEGGHHGIIASETIKKMCEVYQESLCEEKQN